MEHLIPSAAHRYVPTGDSLYKGSHKSIKRLIFYKTPYTDFEQSSLSQFKAYLSSRIPSDLLPPFFCEAELLRILIGSKFSLAKAFDSLLSEIEWRRSILPVSYTAVLSKIESLLRTGVIYIHGRDHKYRPILVIDAANLIVAKYSIEDYCRLFSFIIEFMVTELMLPGKVENFILITNVDNSTQNLSLRNKLKRLYRVFQVNYRYRLALNYIVNASRSFKWICRLHASFMDSDTSEKTKITTSNGLEFLETHCALHQFEEKFGGKAPNTSVFWPPVLPVGSFSALGEPEDISVMPDMMSESDLCSMSEKVKIELPFERKEQVSLLDKASNRNDIGGYNVNSDESFSIPMSDFNTPRSTGSSMRPPSTDPVKDQESAPPKPSRICCKNVRCLIM